MLCTEIVSDIQNNFFTQDNPCSAKRRASDKDLPVILSADYNILPLFQRGLNSNSKFLLH